MYLCCPDLKEAMIARKKQLYNRQQKDREEKGHQQFPSALGVVELPEVRIYGLSSQTKFPR
jgi:hypothetical protein